MIPGGLSLVTETGITNEHTRCVRAYSCMEDPNSQFRPYMEDSIIIITVGYQCIDQYGGFSKQGYFAVFDGHGGKDVADYCCNRLHEILLKYLKDESMYGAEKSINESFISVIHSCNLAG